MIIIFDEYESNLAQWVSEFPKYAQMIHKKRGVFAAQPPPITGSEVTNRQWEEMIKRIGPLNATPTESTGSGSDTN